jgi:transposase
MSQKIYPTYLTDKEWALLEPLLPPAELGGRNHHRDHHHQPKQEEHFCFALPVISNTILVKRPD